MTHLFRQICVTLLTLCLISSPLLWATKTSLTGAGATLPYPLYQKLFALYSEKFDAKVNYQPIGSGAGIMQLQNKTIDLAGTDAFITDDTLGTFKEPVVHIPVCVGAVSIIFNLPGVPTLNLTPSLLSDIFLGNITHWNDPKLKATNPKASLPNSKIIPIRRSDSSGTTYIFSHYLSLVNPEWKQKVGQGMSIKWPAGAGAKHNFGVTKMVGDIPNSIGYVSLPYAIENNLAMASIQNKSGHFIAPSLKSTIKSAKIDLPQDTRISITNTSIKDGYPLTGFTWLVVYQDASHSTMTLDEAKALKSLLTWMLTEGQIYADFMNYAPLPISLVKPALTKINSITFKGAPIVVQ